MNRAGRWSFVVEYRRPPLVPNQPHHQWDSRVNYRPVLEKRKQLARCRDHISKTRVPKECITRGFLFVTKRGQVTANIFVKTFG